MNKKSKKTSIPGGKRKIDTLLKIIFSRKDNFASIFNTLFFQKNELDPQYLKDQNTTEALSVEMPDGTKITIQLCRDIAMLYDAPEKIRLCIYCSENQTDIDYMIPLRNMLYDCASYYMQADLIKQKHKKDEDYANSAEFLSGFRKNDKIIPVFTVVLYYGEEEWDGAKSLKEMMDPIPEDLDGFIQDYRCHIVEIRRLTDGQIDGLSRELKQLFSFLIHSNDEDFVGYAKKNQDLYNSVSDEVALAVSELSNNKDLKQYVNSSTGKGGIKMAPLFEKFFDNARRQGEARIAWQMYNRRGMSIQDIHEIFEEPEIEIEKLINSWQDHLDSQEKEAKKPEE